MEAEKPFVLNEYQGCILRLFKKKYISRARGAGCKRLILPALGSTWNPEARQLERNSVNNPRIWLCRKIGGGAFGSELGIRARHNSQTIDFSWVWLWESSTELYGDSNLFLKEDWVSGPSASVLSDKTWPNGHLGWPNDHLGCNKHRQNSLFKISTSPSFWARYKNRALVRSKRV